HVFCGSRALCGSTSRRGPWPLLGVQWAKVDECIFTNTNLKSLHTIRKRTACHKPYLSDTHALRNHPT
ncbi:MAG: hypothetical protein ACK55Z_24145, partial [bacterium]